MSSEIKQIEIPIIKDDRGQLLAIEQNGNNLPFVPARVFYLMDVPNAQKRAGHAVDSELFVMALKGTVTLINTAKTGKVSNWKLSKINLGVYVPSFHYIELVEFSADAIIAVYAAKKFKDTHYFSLDEIQNRP